jgi:hypothetical protein
MEPGTRSWFLSSSTLDSSSKIGSENQKPILFFLLFNGTNTKMHILTSQRKYPPFTLVQTNVVRVFDLQCYNQVFRVKFL